MRTAESYMIYDRDGGYGWQRIRQRRHEAVKTPAEEMWHRGETMETTKEMRTGITIATEDKDEIRYVGRQGQ